MFAAEERQVFEYPSPDGKSRFADPMAAYRGLVAATAGRLHDLIKSHNRQDSPVVQSEATAKLYAASCAAFGLTPFDPATGRGALEGYALKLMDDFLEWCEVKKKSTGPSSSSPTPTSSSPGQSGSSATSPCGC